MSKFIVFVILFFQTFISKAQPDLSTKIIIEGKEIYRDFRKPNVYYLMPGKLQLANESDGKPKFFLIASRYTGTSVYGDVGEKKFRNILQFGVAMETIEMDVVKKIQNQLGGKDISLLSMPIKNIETIVMIPASGSESKKQIGKDGAFLSTSGAENNAGFWKERMYSIHLENFEAELVTLMIKQGKLALSFSYAFVGDVIKGTKKYKQVSSPRQVFQSITPEINQEIKTDTVITTLALKSETFSINVDTQKWNVIRKIDINENIPPAYSVLEVRCYDFTNQIRPDLAVKLLDIEAIGLNNLIVSLPSIKFLSSEPSVNTIAASFPFAVKLTKPLRYRISEYKHDGERKTYDWVKKENWVEIIDITTTLDSLKFLTKDIEVEITPETLTQQGVSSLEIAFFYTYNKKLLQNNVVFAKNSDVLSKKISLVSDVQTPINYKILVNGNDKVYESKPFSCTENYVLINSKQIGF
ncbi:hypothetical protein [Emticicia sp.]|uniref:hypothetical protein n=1 Tax=Emticicia sp. TaxID=1930953 RepID=UPI003752326F